jgi:hypothetical protein
MVQNGFIQITSTSFCAGVVLDRGLVVRAAPILKYMIGWDRSRVLSYARGRGWRVQLMDDDQEYEHGAHAQ